MNKVRCDLIFIAEVKRRGDTQRRWCYTYLTICPCPGLLLYTPRDRTSISYWQLATRITVNSELERPPRWTLVAPLNPRVLLLSPVFLLLPLSYTSGRRTPHRRNHSSIGFVLIVGL